MIHRVDGLRELGGAILVDAACVVPEPVEFVLLGDGTDPTDFHGCSIEGIRTVWARVLPVFGGIVEELLVLAPCMRKDGVATRDSLRAGEVVELGAVGAEEPHSNWLG